MNQYFYNLIFTYMLLKVYSLFIPAFLHLIFVVPKGSAQSKFKSKIKRSSAYSGMLAGRKEFVLILVGVGRKAQSSGSFDVIKNSFVNVVFPGFARAGF